MVCLPQAIKSRFPKKMTETWFHEPARMSTLFSLKPLDATTWLRSLLSISKVFRLPIDSWGCVFRISHKELWRIRVHVNTALKWNPNGLQQKSLLSLYRLESLFLLYVSIETKTVGEFKLNQSGKQILELIPGTNITWSEDGQRTTPPRDKPPCGFNLEFCQTPSPSKCRRHSCICLY